jgi:type II secretory pathway component PulF
VLAQIAQQLGDMWEAGEPPTRILTSLAQASPNPLVASAFLNAAAEVRNGASVSAALAAQTTATAAPDPRKREAALAAGRLGQPVFPATLSHAVNIAEKAGAFVDPQTGRERGAMIVMMERFANDQLRTDKLVSAIRGAMMYPAAVAGVASAVVAIMLYVAMPKLKEMYVGMTGDGTLPLPTRILIGASDFLVSPFGIVLGLSALLSFAGFILWGTRTPKGRDWIARRSLWVPLFGEMLREANMANLARVFGMMMAGNEGVNYALRETAAAMTNPVYREMLEDVLSEFERQARPLDVLFRPYTPLVTESFHSCLVTYEKSGGMDALMARFADVLETRNERRVEVVKHALNTYLIIPVAVLVALVVVALYMPMFDLIGKMSRPPK